MLNPLKYNILHLKNLNFDMTILFLVLIIFIPIIMQDVSAKTFDITIPKGADDPKNLFHFVPSELTVSVDDKIRWINFDVGTHTVTSGSFQSGPNGIFNSGFLENSEVFSYQINSSDIGTLTYYCTIHPWMNGIISVLDPEGLPVGKISESGSVDAVRIHVEQAESSKLNAEQFVNSSQNMESGDAFSLSAYHYHQTALEYSLLSIHKKSAFYHQESAIQHHNAATQYEKLDAYEKSIAEHYAAGVQHHFASVQYDIIDDQENMRKQLSESLLHKRMAKFGSDYVLPPKHQSRYLDVDDITCKEDFELLLKSTTKEPSCIKSSNVIKLIERGWAIRILDN